ncbi:MAG TPA: DUF697 domain-containing protein [Gammaproteobacteria bacterium]|nr:DUF697 domain-containing protein [Gammaproteobacteria bacterium]
MASNSTVTEDAAVAEGALDHAGPEDRIVQANQAVRNHSILSGALGFIPVPPLGVALIIANGLKMVHKLSIIYDIEFNKDWGKAAIGSFLSACGTYSISSRLIWALSTVVPPAAPVVSVVTRPVFGGALMYLMGKIFIQHFESGGTLLTFDPEKVREHYAALLEKEGKEVAKESA